MGNAVGIIVLPQIARSQSEPDEQRAIARRWLVMTVGLILVVVAAMEVAVAPLIRIAFGDEFEGAITAARWLIVADGFLALRKVLIAILQAQGRGGPPHGSSFCFCRR